MLLNKFHFKFQAPKSTFVPKSDLWFRVGIGNLFVFLKGTLLH